MGNPDQKSKEYFRRRTCFIPLIYFRISTKQVTFSALKTAQKIHEHQKTSLSHEPDFLFKFCEIWRILNRKSLNWDYYIKTDLRPTYFFIKSLLNVRTKKAGDILWT